MSEILRVGQRVPDFEMDTFEPESGGFGKISLAELKKQGKWTVLFFYPADYTFVCPTELADLATQYNILKEAGVEVISVSTDTHFVHLAWHREENLLKGLTYKMGADPTGRISRLFNVYDDSTGLALRGTFIINPDGVLVGQEVNFYNFGRNAEELTRKMKANVYLAKHPEEACPAKWRDGDKTLTPGAALVGRVGDTLSRN